VCWVCFLRNGKAEVEIRIRQDVLNGGLQGNPGGPCCWCPNACSMHSKQPVTELLELDSSSSETGSQTHSPYKPPYRSAPNANLLLFNFQDQYYMACPMSHNSALLPHDVKVSSIKTITYLSRGRRGRANSDSSNYFASRYQLAV
jgi:hypothetical protein